MRQLIFIILLSLTLSSCATNPVTSDSYQLYLVRHAEKQSDGTHNPHLTDQGQQRAIQLAAWFADKPLADIWSSDYHRTRETAQPVANSKELNTQIYDPRDLPALADTLLERSNNALIVGHSNTTPDLAQLLCQCDIADMDESEYDRLIIVTVDGSHVTVSTLQQN